MNAIVKIAVGVVAAKAVNAIAKKAPEVKNQVAAWAERQHSKAIKAKLEKVTGGQVGVNQVVAERFNDRKELVHHYLGGTGMFYRVAKEVASLKELVDNQINTVETGSFNVNWEHENALVGLLSLVTDVQKCEPHEFIFMVLHQFDSDIPMDVARTPIAYKMVTDAIANWFENYKPE